MENLSDHLLMSSLLCRHRNRDFDIQFQLIRPVYFRRKMEKTRSAKKEMDGLVFISRQSWHISLVIIKIKVLFPTLYLYLACKQLCLSPTKRHKQRNEHNRKEIRNITLIISWLYWLRLLVYSEE